MPGTLSLDPEHATCKAVLSHQRPKPAHLRPACPLRPAGRPRSASPWVRQAEAGGLRPRNGTPGSVLPESRSRASPCAAETVTDTSIRPGHCDRCEGGDKAKSTPRSRLNTAGPNHRWPHVRLFWTSAAASPPAPVITATPSHPVSAFLTPSAWLPPQTASHVPPNKQTFPAPSNRAPHPHPGLWPHGMCAPSVPRLTQPVQPQLCLWVSGRGHWQRPASLSGQG